jgi:ABC-type nitrate/sulfonate/bicarbonate transport system permease component
MTAAALARSRVFPAALGLGSFVAAIALVELLIRIGVINRFIVPMPSDIIAAFPRVIAEEDVLSRFLLTVGEAFSASILVALFGIAGGVLLYQVRLLRAATETWVAAMAAAPLVLIYPLYLVIFGRSAVTIVMMGFTAGLAPIILKTLEGLAGTRRVFINVGRSFNLTSWQLFWKILFPAALPTIFVGVRLGLIFALINIVGVEFLINFGGLGQLINELAERYDLPGTYAAICFVILVSICVFVATERLERGMRSANPAVVVAVVLAALGVVIWWAEVAPWLVNLGPAVGRLLADPRFYLYLAATLAAVAAAVAIVRAARPGAWLSQVTLLRAFIILATLIGWEALSRSGLLYRDVVPALGAIGAGLGRTLTDTGFFGHLGTTSYEIGVGLLIGGLSGLVVGIALGGSKLLRRAYEPLLHYLGPTPKIIFFPVMIMWFGVGPGSKMAMGAISCFFPVALNVAGGMREIDAVLIRVGQSFRANIWQMVTKIYLPAMRQPVINGVRLGLGVALIGTLLAETKLSNRGIGFLVIQAYSLFNMPQMYALLIILFVIAIGANTLIGRLGRVDDIRRF